METILSIGDKLEITKINTNMTEKHGEDKRKYVCKIIDIINDTSYKITIPIVSGKLIPLEIGATYDTCFFVKNNIYGCETTVTGRGQEGKIYFATIDVLTKLEKIQRRQFYRLSLFDDFAVAAAVNPQEEMQWNTATLLDISGGGLRFISKIKYEADATLLCKLPFIFADDYCIKGNVIASYYHNDDKAVYETRLIYDDMKPNIREKIIRFIFEEERRQRAKQYSS